MLKNLIAISRCLCLVGITALPSASRAQTANSAADYWPMQTGNTWTLLLKVGPDQTIKQVVTVTNVAKADDGSVATINYVSNGKTIQIEKYKITAAQIVRLEAGPNGSFKATPPVPIIKFPLTAGKTWDLYRGCQIGRADSQYSGRFHRQWTDQGFNAGRLVPGHTCSFGTHNHFPGTENTTTQ